MMRYLIDTNVLSELRKRTRCHRSVAAWEHTELAPRGGAVSVLTIGEIRKGIDLISQRDPQQASSLEFWLNGLLENFVDRILPITTDVALEWGRLNGLRPLPAVDSMLAATANVYGLILATRNVGDLVNVGVSVVNPFEYEKA